MSSEYSVTQAVIASAQYREAIKQPLKSEAAIGYALSLIMRSVGEGCSCALLLDAHGHHIATLSLRRGGKPTDEPMLELLEREMLSRGVVYFAIAHSHGGDELRPSRADRAATERIRARFADTDACFIDHFIISGGSWSTVLGDSSRGDYRSCAEAAGV